MARHVVITGNPVDGINVHGPFATIEFAIDYADNWLGDNTEWWLAPLVDPNHENDEGHDWTGLRIEPSDTREPLPATIQQGQGMTTLLRPQIERYLDDPDRCPVCRSGDISGEGVEIIEGMAYQRVNCAVCDASWSDAYEFVYIVDEHPERTRASLTRQVGSDTEEVA